MTNCILVSLIRAPKHLAFHIRMWSTRGPFGRWRQTDRKQTPCEHALNIAVDLYHFFFVSCKRSLASIVESINGTMSFYGAPATDLSNVSCNVGVRRHNWNVHGCSAGGCGGTGDANVPIPGLPAALINGKVGVPRSDSD